MRVEVFDFYSCALLQHGLAKAIILQSLLPRLRRSIKLPYRTVRLIHPFCHDEATLDFHDQYLSGLNYAKLRVLWYTRPVDSLPSTELEGRWTPRLVFNMLDSDREPQEPRHLTLQFASSPSEFLVRTTDRTASLSL